jgi:predicted negative regulator of RcsB-dependent stress response
VAEKIFRWVVDHCRDERSQAYARNHLGRVLYRQGRLEEALAMYESVQLQSSGQDFWYVDARDDAAMTACEIIQKNSAEPQYSQYYAAAVRNHKAAIAACGRDNVKAVMYLCLANVYINREVDKAMDSYRHAYQYGMKSGKTEEAMLAKKHYDFYRKNPAYVSQLSNHNKEPL